MAKKFTIDCSLRDSAAVDGYIWSMLPGTKLVDDLGKTSFPVPLSPVISTVRSVGATCLAISIDLISKDELPIIPKRCLIAWISMLILSKFTLAQKYYEILTY